MREKKYFDSYVDYRSPANGALDSNTAHSSAHSAAAGSNVARISAASNNAANSNVASSSAASGNVAAGEVSSGNVAGKARVLTRPSETAIAPYSEGEPGNGNDDWEPEFTERADPLRRLFDLLWRRRWIVLPILLGALLLGLLYTLRSGKTYQATATLLVNTSPLSGEKRPDNASSPDAPPTDVPGVDAARRLETQLEIVKTEGVFQAAAQSLDPDDQAAIERFYTLDVGSIRNTDLVTVTVGSPSPDASAALANAICDSYIEQSQKNNRRAIQAAADTAGDQLKTVRAELGDARDELKNYQAKIGITDGQQQAQNVANALQTNKTELAQAREAQAAAAASLRVQQDVLANTPREIVSYSTVTRPTVITLRAELTRLQIERTAARAEYTAESTIVREIDSKIARVQSQLQSEPENETLPAQRAPNPAYITASENLGRARAELQSLRARIPVLEANLQRANTAQAQLPAKTARLSQLTSAVTGLQTTYDELAQKAQNLQLSAASQLSNGTVTSPATPPGVPAGRGRTTILLMSLILGGLLAYLTALLVDRLDEKIHSSAQAQNAARLPILIDVPRINKRLDQSVLTGNAPLLRESFEMLTAQLALAARSVPLRSVMVTSSLPGEGKSVSCVNLAVAAAWAGEEVVLVDCDGRNPSLHEYFGLSNNVGFSDVVTGRVPIGDAVQATRIPGLNVLTSGTPHESPLELLRSVEAQNLIDELSSLADLTIIDSPPTLIIADASVLATMTDATLLVVACGEASKSEIARATNTLHQTGARVLGIVLTKVAPKLGAAHTYNYSGYVSHHSTENLRGPVERGIEVRKSHAPVVADD